MRGAREIADELRRYEPGESIADAVAAAIESARAEMSRAAEGLVAALERIESGEWRDADGDHCSAETVARQALATYRAAVRAGT